MIKKRFISILALLCLTVSGAWAEEVYLTLIGVYRPGTSNGISANGYFIYSNTLSQEDAVAAFSSAGASYESTIASSAALTVGIAGGEWYDWPDVSDAGAPMYVLCFDQDNNSMYVSPVANPEFDEDSYTWVYDIDAGVTSSAAAMSASGGYQGAGWYSVATSNVPSWVRAGDTWDDETNTLTVNSNPGDAYANNTEIENLVISDAVTSIGDWAFSNCSGLTSVTIGNSVTSIGESAFQYCSSLTSITIGNSVTSIGDYAFNGCSGLTSIVVASGNTKYDSRENCNAIIETSSNTLIAGCKNTIIPNSVTSIGMGAFLSCTGLTSITIPNSVTSIGMQAFAYCSGLTSITIPNSVTSIGAQAFAVCSNLETVAILAESLESYGTNAFLGTAATLKIYVPAGSVGTYKAGWAAYEDKFEAIVVERVQIGDLYYNLTNYKTAEVTYQVMSETNYSSLTAVNIPESVEYNSVTYSVTSIGMGAFLGCTGLTSITIPSSVTSIGMGAFQSCEGLTSIEIPNSVTSIGDAAFYGCTGLTSVIIGNSVTSIGYVAFYYCTGLTNITIPNSVTSIGESAFDTCSGLTSVTILAESLESYGNGAFDGTAAALKIYVPAGSVDTYKAGWAAYEDKIEAIPTLNLTSPTVGQVIGSDGMNYAANATLPTGVTKVAMIAYVSGSNGLAIALADEGSLNWETAKSTCEAKTPAFTNGTWKLPTQAEWNQMFSANGGNEDSYTGLNTTINTAGGTTLQETIYWSSSEKNSGVDAYGVDLDNGNARWWSVAENYNYRVRACLAFEVEVTLTDGEAITGLDTYKGQEIRVNYTRSFTEGKTSTVCLPFAYTKKTGDGSFYAFTKIEKNGSGEYVATMTEPGVSTLTANTPYLYLPNATGDVDFGGAYTIPASLTAGSTTSNGWTFKGTYETITWTTAPTGIYGFSAQTADGISQGEFVKVGDYVRIKPMRCYLENASFAGARGANRAAEQLPETIKVRLIGANGEVTGIGTISTKTGEGTIDNGAWYSLDGRRIEGKPSTKGVYINNGNKVIIK